MCISAQVSLIVSPRFLTSSFALSVVVYRLTTYYYSNAAIVSTSASAFRLTSLFVLPLLRFQLVHRPAKLLVASVFKIQDVILLAFLPLRVSISAFASVSLSVSITMYTLTSARVSKSASTSSSFSKYLDFKCLKIYNC